MGHDVSLDNFSFDNTFVRTLPGDPIESAKRRQVLGACYSRVAPTPVAKPKLLACAREVAELLDLSEAQCESPEFAEIFAGNRVLPGMAPYAACYGGHQFGNWAGQLGDGRAITLGEHVNAKGQRWELQLKGAGPTPYSRTADGRAVVRSSVREFLCSEAMHHLGVPTTRALSLVATGDPVMRDMFYDGHPAYEPGAIVCRVAPSFVRFGNFEIFAAREDTETLRKLADYVISTHYPELITGSTSPSRETYIRWFEEVSRRTADMVTHWMRVGFVHGVMNTDNMSALGLTIDYGPYGWLEDYDLDWTPNTTDAQGRRYRYGHQPRIAWWNVTCLANALLPLVGSVEPFQAILEAGAQALGENLQRMMCKKVGLRDESFIEQDPLIEALPRVLHRCELDMTLFYRALGELAFATEEPIEATAASATEALLRDTSYAADSLPSDERASLTAWLSHYAQRLREERIADDVRRTSMHAINPKYVLRNYLAQLAIDKAEQGDGSMVCELLEVLRHPYDEQPGRESFAERRPEWARHRAGCSMLSCSS